MWHIESDLPWAELAAIPETYATAWTCLFRNLEITQGQTLVIRGGTSAFGQAAIQLAVNVGARVIATTRKRERFAMLEELGADRVELEGADLSKRIAEANSLTRCSTWWAIAPSSILLTCCAGAVGPVWRAGWVASTRSLTSTRCCKWQAVSI
jgi:D-arabinose 1-dehydrogenase-like Zn-dependent alcohol dehydrogenase